MRHYDRAELRHLNDSERYRDYDYLADDGWPPAPEPLSMRGMPEAPSAAHPPLEVQRLASPPLWRLLLTAFLNPRRTIRKVFVRQRG